MMADGVVEAGRPRYELPRYKLPNKNSLNQAHARSDGLNPDYFRVFSYLKITAPKRGFDEFHSFSTPKGGLWHLLERPNYPIPNFPDGETNSHSALAIYDKSGSFYQGDFSPYALLRVSPEPIDRSEFESDIRTLNDGFIERPAMLSILKSNFEIRLLAGGILGTSGNFVMGNGESLSLLTAAAATGVLAVVGGSAVSRFAEARALGKVSNLSEYFAGDEIQYIFDVQERHALTVSLQREFLERLKKDLPDLTPETFLKGIYAQMPEQLIQQRKIELSYPTVGTNPTPSLISSSLDDLLTVARVLPAYRNPQPEPFTPKTINYT